MHLNGIAAYRSAGDKIGFGQIILFLWPYATQFVQIINECKLVNRA